MGVGKQLFLRRSAFFVQWFNSVHSKVEHRHKQKLRQTRVRKVFSLQSTRCRIEIKKELLDTKHSSLGQHVAIWRIVINTPIYRLTTSTNKFIIFHLLFIFLLLSFFGWRLSWRLVPTETSTMRRQRKESSWILSLFVFYSSFMVASITGSPTGMDSRLAIASIIQQ